MPGDVVATRLESLGEVVFNAEHTFPRTDQGYDGEKWLYYEEGQIVEQVYSLPLARWTTFGAEQFEDTQLTASQVNNLAATNIELVAAPPAGTALWPTRVHLFLDHGGTNFVQVNNSDALAIRYSASTEIQELGSEAQMTTLLEAAADAALTIPVTSPAVPIAATALDLDNNGAAEYTTGDGTLSVRVWYVIEPMAAFS
jgi:hypothetical protein